MATRMEGPMTHGKMRMDALFRSLAHSSRLLCSLVCSCLAIVNAGDGDTLFTAADVVITGCSFRNSQATFGGCLALEILNSLTLTESTFDHCTGLTQNALVLVVLNDRSMFVV